MVEQSCNRTCPIYWYGKFFLFKVKTQRTQCRVVTSQVDLDLLVEVAEVRVRSKLIWDISVGNEGLFADRSFRLLGGAVNVTGQTHEGQTDRRTDGSAATRALYRIAIYRLYRYFGIIHFSCTIHQTVHLCFKFRVFWSLKFLNSHEMCGSIKLFWSKTSQNVLLIHIEYCFMCIVICIVSLKINDTEHCLLLLPLDAPPNHTCKNYTTFLQHTSNQVISDKLSWWWNQICKWEENLCFMLPGEYLEMCGLIWSWP